MKRISIIVMAALMALVACTKTELKPLTGIFPEAIEPVLTELAYADCEKTDVARIFNVMFTGEGGASVDAYLVGIRAQYYLEPGIYGPGTKNLCFLVNGETTINGKAVVDGQISVKKDEDTYRFIFVLFDADGNAYRTQWQGELIYLPDPEPVALTKVLTAQANANGTVTVKLGTDDMSVDMMGTPVGDGYALTADLYGPDGFLHEGVYFPAEGEVTGEGEYTPGYEVDLSIYGGGIYHWGTCWWVADEATHITTGPLTVERKGTKWVITWGSEDTYPDWAVFEGEIEGLTPEGGDDFDGTTLTQFLGSADYTGYGINLAGVDLGTDGITVTAGAWGNTYGGDGNYLKLEFYSTDGKLAAGEYEPCAEGGNVTEGTFGIGYDGMYGASGTTWYTMAGGEATGAYVTDGHLSVTVEGDVYTIILTSSVINAKYQGKLSAE